MPSRERATCAGCGLVCDDIEAVVGDDGGIERLIRTCPLGDAWFADRVAPAAPLARLGGGGGGLDAAPDGGAAAPPRGRPPPGRPRSWRERAPRSSTGWAGRPARPSA